MSKLILITGGAGFIGSHVADQLLASGYRVRALDNLDPQVHGPNAKRPDYLDARVELEVGDVRDKEAVRCALDGVDAVFHFASAVGVAQSMYQIAHYTAVNNMGTAVLLEELAHKPVERLIVASSMSLYGEGLYRASDGSETTGTQRSLDRLKASDWEVYGEDGGMLTPIPTPETKQPDIASVYALSKYDQERMCLMVGGAYGIATVALRFFNVFGPRQALSNPYTGVLAIFASRLLNGKSPIIYEDGLQRRDFVSVYDVARACRLALEAPNVAGEVFNIGSGTASTVREVALRVAEALDVEHLGPQIVGSYRVGDIRHCFADISRARQLLDYAPAMTLDAGIADLVPWLEKQEARDRAEDAAAELAARGLTV